MLGLTAKSSSAQGTRSTVCASHVARPITARPVCLDARCLAVRPPSPSNAAGRENFLGGLGAEPWLCRVLDDGIRWLEPCMRLEGRSTYIHLHQGRRTRHDVVSGCSQGPKVTLRGMQEEGGMGKYCLRFFVPPCPSVGLQATCPGDALTAAVSAKSISLGERGGVFRNSLSRKHGTFAA